MCAQLNMGSSGTETPSQGRQRLEIPYAEVTGVFASPVEQANSFVKGKWVSSGSPWVLATKDDRDGEIDGLVFKATSLRFWVVTSGIVTLVAHGLGSAGQTLWLSTGGTTSPTKPAGPSNVVQRVGRVIDVDRIKVQIEHPEIF